MKRKRQHGGDAPSNDNGKTKDDWKTKERWKTGEVARALGISVGMVRKLIGQRQIPFYRIGAHMIFSAAEVRAFEQQHRVEARSDNGSGEREGQPRGWKQRRKEGRPREAAR